MTNTGGLVFDASVLIDYVAADPAMLGLVAQHVRPVVIPVLVLAEVDGLNLNMVSELGLMLHDHTELQLNEALQRTRSLSFQDLLCFTTARDLGLTCVTNDVALSAHCGAAGVPTARGFRPLIKLVELGVVRPVHGIRIVRLVHTTNTYITRAVVVAFVREVRRLRPP